MRIPSLLFCCALAFAAGTTAIAEQGPALDADGAAPAAEEESSGSRSAGDLSVEERTQMMQAANGYHTCVYQEAMQNIDSDPDIRRIADLALGLCQPRLDELRDTITGWGIDHYFAEGFTRNVRDRATHQLLPELAVKKGR
jgi:hypothetical protein